MFKACLLGVYSFLFCSRLLAQPSIAITGGTLIRLGEIYQGNVPRKELIVRNAGNDTLRIGEIETSCSCTVPAIGKREIAPGDSGTIVVEFDSRGYEGLLRKELYVKSNDPIQPRLEIDLFVTVSSIIVLEPKALRFGIQKKGSTVTETMVIRNTGADSVRLLSINVPDPLITAKVFKKVLPPNASTTIKFTLKARRTGKYNSLIECLTDSKLQPSIKFPYYGLVSP